MYPALYQVNARILLAEVAAASAAPAGGATFADLPEALLDAWAQLGCDWIWLLGVWRTGPAAQQVSRSHAGWRKEFAAALPDVREADITGSPFAVQAYEVHPDFGGPAALAALRARLAERGLKLMLDFVPNHTAPDHAWVRRHPEYYVAGTEDDLFREPHNYLRVETDRGPQILAHGRDPNFPGWPDTLQLDYRASAVQAAMTAELLQIAAQCDGLRCDMAMLLLPDVLARTWGGRPALPAEAAAGPQSFWQTAIAALKARFPDFCLLAEVYWDRESDLQQQGFDYTYDKRLYDRLHAGSAGAVRAHLQAELSFQNRCARFLENHDEARAGAAFPWDKHQAAALLTYLAPGLRFFHEGQFEGRQVRLPIHLGRRPVEPAQGEIHYFYQQLLAVVRTPALRAGGWRLGDCRLAWAGNPTADQFLAYAWDGPQGERLLVVVNYGPNRGQCRLAWPWPDDASQGVLLDDVLSGAAYDRTGAELAAHGLYLDLPAWGRHLFEVHGR